MDARRVRATRRQRRTMNTLASPWPSLAALLPAMPTMAQEQASKPAVRAASAMACSSNPSVTKSTAEVVRRGGNALGAILNTVPTRAVIEPQMVTLAGGFSVVDYDAKSAR